MSGYIIRRFSNLEQSHEKVIKLEDLGCAAPKRPLSRPLLFVSCPLTQARITFPTVLTLENCWPLTTSSRENEWSFLHLYVAALIDCVDDKKVPA